MPKDWQSKKISEIADQLIETAGESVYETVSISAGIGFVNQAKKLAKSYPASNIRNILYCIKGIFLIIREILICIHKDVFIDLMIGKLLRYRMYLRVFVLRMETRIIMNNYLPVVF